MTVHYGLTEKLSFQLESLKMQEQLSIWKFQHVASNPLHTMEKLKFFIKSEGAD